MYAKVFTQILDSSLAENWQTRHVFEDLLKLCDADGIVDMTHEAIARRTNVPIEIIRSAIADLEHPDPKSRTPTANGIRIVRLDEHRDWGWAIVNHGMFRKIATEDQRKAKQRERFTRWKKKHEASEQTAANAPLTPSNASNAIQKQKQKQKQKQREEGVKGVSGEQLEPTGMTPGEGAKLSLLPMVKEVFEEWNNSGLTKCLVLSDKRRRSLECRLREEFFQQNWRQSIARIKASNFCRGENGRGWSASLDWFISRDVVTKVMEGRYDNRAVPQQSSQPVRQASARDRQLLKEELAGLREQMGYYAEGDEKRIELSRKAAVLEKQLEGAYA